MDNNPPKTGGLPSGQTVNAKRTNPLDDRAAESEVDRVKKLRRVDDDQDTESSDEGASDHNEVRRPRPNAPTPAAPAPPPPRRARARAREPLETPSTAQVRDSLVGPTEDDLHLLLLQRAAEGDAVTVRELLARGADPRPRRMNFFGDDEPAALTALARAVLSPNVAGGEAVAVALFDDGRLDLLRPEYCVATRMTPEITARKASQLDSNVVSLVHYAAAKGRMGLLALCLHHPNAPAHAADADGHYGPVATARRGRCTPLHVAALADGEAAVDALLDAGAELHARDCDGFDPLYLAARFGCDGAMAALLRRPGCDPDHTANAGHTPIFLAARYGHLGCVFKLLRAGASLAVRALPSGARSPLDYAIHKHGAANCDERVLEQRECIEFLAGCERRGGLGAWCAAERAALASLRALVFAGRARYEASAAFAASTPYFAAFAYTCGGADAGTKAYHATLKIHHTIAALFGAKDFPVEVFSLVVEFWLSPRVLHEDFPDDDVSLLDRSDDDDDDRYELSVASDDEAMEDDVVDVADLE